MSNPKNVIEMAKEIAMMANPDYRRDGFEEEIYAVTLKYLQQAYDWGADSIRDSICYQQREDMGH